MADELVKTTTKVYYGCRVCHAKMETIALGSGDAIFGLSSKTNAYWCQNKECNRYGDLTIAGFRIEE